MRDIGTLVWVVLVFVGVISSIAKSSRKQRLRQAATVPPRPTGFPMPLPPAQVQPPQGQPLRVHVAPAKPKIAPVTPLPQMSATAHHEMEPAHRPARKRVAFSDRGQLVRAVVAFEVLGKPLALRDE